MKSPTRNSMGFTLIELMLVVAILGILASVALPRMVNLVNRAREAEIKADLGTLRSAINLYYCQTEGRYPDQDDPASALVGTFINEIPTVTVPPNASNPGHEKRSGFWYLVAGIQDNFARAWAYSEITGEIVVNCAHDDYRGIRWRDN